uniref:Uncharacterized protein n=1 Tax=Cacopsylla melanoneura TaxID=428564 RepID=A0A8D8Z5R1_9HEMI
MALHIPRSDVFLFIFGYDLLPEYFPIWNTLPSKLHQRGISMMIIDMGRVRMSNSEEQTTNQTKDIEESGMFSFPTQNVGGKKDYSNGSKNYDVETWSFQSRTPLPSESLRPDLQKKPSK